MSLSLRVLPLLVLVVGAGLRPGWAQLPADSRAPAALNVFLDCDRCDHPYIRQEIAFVNYVRDRADAQVHVLITTEDTGSSRVYTLTFIGRQAFASVDDTLRYASSNTDTDDERRAGLVRVIKLGLVRYLARTPQAGQLAVVFDGEQTTQTTPDDDPWNFWVFEAGVDGGYEAEESTNFLRVGGDLDADRVTADWKIQLALDANYRETNFDLDDEHIRSINRDGQVRGLMVKSLGPHWGAGGFANVSTSSFNNTDFSLAVSPAIEYNLFPYAESSRREFRLTYFFNFRVYDYEQETIFGKTSDVLLHHAFEVSYEATQPWGEAEVELEVSNYLTDFEETLFDFYQAELGGRAELRVVRGLSLFVYGEVSRIRDQLFLSAEELSDEEILLGSRRLATSYEYEVALGFSYTFGSIYNSIVNSRFGS